ncbi:PA domain-containing protein [Arthrobacter sp. AL12]|uniref:PA domain-containing protein n=1 Tax=Arthrobacter sp. AL12 TaxID=3042241 RepID=UPI00249BC726|nr:PA domain-containing protein [Arthrobacter sp. AL12]MDI3213322.1 hypothetical protein [Arthrobacter sp. AL12]
MRQTRNIQRAAIAATIGLAVSFAPPALAAPATNSGALRSAVSAANIMTHLSALQKTADANGGNRAAGTSGYEASARYIEGQLRAVGYTTARQPFTYERYSSLKATLARVSPTPNVYSYEKDFLDLDHSGDGDVTEAVTGVDLNLIGDRASTSGCEAGDFAAFPTGNIALIQRGTCTFRIKVDAVAAGAKGVIIFNQGNVVPDEDRTLLFGGMVGSPNFVRFFYDGDGSAFGEKGPNGSALVEKVFLASFKSQSLPVAPTAFDGRSDYSGFINNGIPAGGLFTAAEDPKTEEEAAIFGGGGGSKDCP